LRPDHRKFLFKILIFSHGAVPPPPIVYLRPYQGLRIYKTASGSPWYSVRTKNLLPKAVYCQVSADWHCQTDKNSLQLASVCCWDGLFTLTF